MVKLEIVTSIKHGGAEYHDGEVRLLDEQTAQYFVRNGWAKYPGGQAQHPDTAPKTLDVQPGKHGHSNPGVK